MDPRTLEINSLRVLNDYLNQTIEAIVRAQRVGVSPLAGAGLSHTPFYAQNMFSPFGANFGAGYGTAFGAGVDPVTQGLTHSLYGAGAIPFAGATPFNTGFSPYASVIDPFMAQRNLSHTQLSAWTTPWSPLTDIARLQAMRAWGVPV